MNLQELYAWFDQALIRLRKVAADYDPLTNHRYIDKDKGGSYFCDDIKSINDVIALTEKSKLRDIIPGQKGAFCLVFEKWGFIVGVEVVSKCIKGKVYKFMKVHGMLQPVGEIEVEGKDTSFYTLVLFPEIVDGKIQFVIASAYPGLPDNAKPVPEEYEGKEMSAEEIEENGWRPRAFESK